MKSIKRILETCLPLAFSVMAASCSGGSSNAVAAAPGGNVVSSTLSEGGVERQFYIYDNTAETSDTKAVVFLHGAGGSNLQTAYDLGIDRDAPPSPPTNDTVNWGWSNSNGILAVFPNGLALDGGTRTWSNWVMTSGQDDKTFLQDLAAYIRTHYPTVTKVYIAGHSNGGMMANRMWCESPETFDGYIAMAGPASYGYVSNPSPGQPTSCPMNSKPYYAIVGGADTVLFNYALGPSFDSAKWTISPEYVSLAAAQSWVNPDLIGEFSQDQARSTSMCGAAHTFDILHPSADNNPGQPNEIKTWSCGGGILKLQEIVNSNHSLNDSTGPLSPGLQVTSGEQMIDLIADFIAGLGG